jgi:hypothetical protein
MDFIIAYHFVAFQFRHLLRLLMVSINASHFTKRQFSQDVEPEESQDSKEMAPSRKSSLLISMTTN